MLRARPAHLASFTFDLTLVPPLVTVRTGTRVYLKIGPRTLSTTQGVKPKLAQSRKKAILEQVENQRRRNRIISLSAIVLIAVVIVAVVIALPRTGNAVPLPGYLDHCVVASPLLYHSHPSVSITINGSSVGIPSGVGVGGACNHPIHTHSADGVLHVETDEDRDYTMGDFFLIWGNHDNDAQRAMFNSTQIFGARAVNGRTLTMTVNGASNSEFQNYILPRTACESPSACQSQPSFQLYTIAINYV